MALDPLEILQDAPQGVLVAGPVEILIDQPPELDGDVLQLRGGGPEQVFAEVERLLALDDLKADAARRREQLLADKIDVTAWMIDFFESGRV